MSAPLVLGKDAGGPRHFVAGRPVRCGTYLRLEPRVDEDGVGADRLEPALVRYEATFLDGEPPTWVRFYGQLAGWRVELAHDEGMRFAWPDGQDEEHDHQDEDEAEKKTNTSAQRRRQRARHERKRAGTGED